MQGDWDLILALAGRRVYTGDWQSWDADMAAYWTAILLNFGTS